MPDDRGQLPPDEGIDALRARVDDVNGRILDLLSERARLAEHVGALKRRLGQPLFNASRENAMLDALVASNPGPLSDEAIRNVFRAIFRASLELMEEAGVRSLRVGRAAGAPDVVVRVGDREVGGRPVVIAGPCSVEDAGQMEAVAAALARLGIGFLRGGAFKPRTSPCSFQGLGEPGLVLLAEAARRHGLATVTEVVDTRLVEVTARHADILQVGSRNMANYELLKAVAAAGKPVLLKRGFAATIVEFLQAAEYVAQAGNEQIILCERGIRTFESETRFTLDISAVPLLRRMSRLPVVVDVSHAAGRTDILADLARAALAAGAHGVMVEVHPHPALARSDNEQQVDVEGFERLLGAIREFL